MKKNTSGEDFKSLKILHLALIMGASLIAVVIYYLADREKAVFSYDFQMLELAAISLAFISPVMAYVINNTRLQKIDASSSLPEKWSNYRAIQISKYALIEGSILINIIVFFLNNNLLLFLIALILMPILYFMKPTKEKIVEDLNISHAEVENL